MSSVPVTSAGFAPVQRDVRSSDEAISWRIDKIACWLLVVAVVFINGADFRGDTGEEFSVHWQIYLRLLVAFASGCVGLLLFPSKTWNDFLTWPGLLIGAYLIWYGVTLVTAIDRAYCTAAWVSLVGVLLLLPAAMRTLGGYRFWQAVTTGLTLYLVGSWIAYLFFPQIGVFKEQVTQTYAVERMGGLGHPNELGFYAAYTFLAYLGLMVSGRLNWNWGAIGMALAVATLLTCFSRTAILTCAVGTVFALRSPLRQPGNMVSVLGITALGALIAFGALGAGKLDWYLDSLLTSVTKSGSTDELATATGRTEIWQYGIAQIQKSPVTGYGYCAARFVMEKHSYHCHNIVLNALMYGGVISGLLVVCMILNQWIAIFAFPRPEIDGMILCLLIGSMVEELLSAASPSASVLLWFSLMFWRQLGMEMKRPATVA